MHSPIRPGRLARHLVEARADALIVARSIVSGDDAEDVVQEATLRVLGAASRGTVVEDPRAYLRAVVRQVAFDCLRAGGSESSVADLSDHPSPHANPQSAVELREVFAAIDALPDNQREALLGTALTPHDQRTLARLLHTTPAGLRQLVLRARRRLLDTVGALIPWLTGHAGELVAAAGPGGPVRSGAVAIAVAAIVAPAAPSRPVPPAPRVDALSSPPRFAAPPRPLPPRPAAPPWHGRVKE